MQYERLIELESLCAAATEPPWTDMLDREHPDHHLIIGGQSRDIADVMPWMTTVEPDARFIAESRAALPEALRTIRDLQRELAAALRERDALCAMLDEILALEDVETPSKDGSENVASAVGDALEHLRRERDESREATVTLSKKLGDAQQRMWALEDELKLIAKHLNVEHEDAVVSFFVESAVRERDELREELGHHASLAIERLRLLTEARQVAVTLATVWHKHPDWLAAAVKAREWAK